MCWKVPCVLRKLRMCLRFSAQLQTKADFITRSIDINQLPRHYWKILRRNYINTTASALQKHTSNEHETMLESSSKIQHKQALHMYMH